jgi:hypothetical protein
VRTTNVLDVSHITDMAELAALERALNATIAKMEDAQADHNGSVG